MKINMMCSQYSNLYKYGHTRDYMDWRVVYLLYCTKIGSCEIEVRRDHDNINPDGKRWKVSHSAIINGIKVTDTTYEWDVCSSEASLKNRATRFMNKCKKLFKDKIGE